eukprot:4807555-Amphidinium_carterae.1
MYPSLVVIPSPRIRVCEANTAREITEIPETQGPVNIVLQLSPLQMLTPSNGTLKGHVDSFEFRHDVLEARSE